MGIERLGLSEDDLVLLAGVTDRAVVDLRAELDARPWSILDLLGHSAVVTAALEPEDPFRLQVSPFLFFAVLAQKAATELRSTNVVNEWTGPRQRLPVFDVEPLREFSEAPGRVVFLARLLATFCQPQPLALPVNALDMEDVAAWLEVAEASDRSRLLAHLGDLALFRAGVLADETGPQSLDHDLLTRLLRPLGLDADDILVTDPASISPGIDIMESLGPTWYRAASDADDKGTLSLVVSDIATRFRPARRFLNHLADAYLNPGKATIGFTL